MQYAYIAAQEAIEQSGIESFHPDRTGIVMGTALEGLTLAASTQEELSTKGKHVSPKFLTKYMGNIAASQLSIQYGIKGPSLTVTTACSSGGDAITVASMLLKAGMADTIVVMAGESAINPVLIQSLAMSGALSRTGMSRPFDQKRRRFYHRRRRRSINSRNRRTCRKTRCNHSCRIVRLCQQYRCI